MSENLSVGIYHLNWNFEHLRLEEGTETTMNGILKYQISEKGLKHITKQYGEINFRGIEELLTFRVQNALFMTLSETSGRDLLEQKEIVRNRTRILVRNLLKEMGLEYVDFDLSDIWIWGEEVLNDERETSLKRIG